MSPTAALFGWRREPGLSADLHAVLVDMGLEVVFAAQLDWKDQPYLGFDVNQHPDFIFNFSPALFTKEDLALAKVAAINLHTGPPRWPGRGSCSMALLHGDTEFGVTSHLMEEKIDAGDILEVLDFQIDPTETVESLRAKALLHIPALARRTVKHLKEHAWRPAPNSLVWARKAVTQKELLAAMELEWDDQDVPSLTEVSRKLCAFKHAEKPGPYITLYGHRFWYLEGK